MRACVSHANEPTRLAGHGDLHAVWGGISNASGKLRVFTDGFRREQDGDDFGVKKRIVNITFRAGRLNLSGDSDFSEAEDDERACARKHTQGATTVFFFLSLHVRRSNAYAY